MKGDDISEKGGLAYRSDDFINDDSKDGCKHLGLRRQQNSKL